jgi:hypothetical protein
MDNQHPLTPEGFRTAAYLAARERLDARKTTRNVQCNPPNVRCGNRCIPPTWDCRLKGQGADPHLRAVKTDPLGGLANIQRGFGRISKGIVKGNFSEVEGGKRAIIRGSVKIAPGNIQQKKELQKKLEDRTRAIGIGLAVVTGGLGIHALLMKSDTFGYRNGVGANINNATRLGVSRVLDAIPGIGSKRARVRAAVSTGVQEQLTRQANPASAVLTGQLARTRVTGADADARTNLVQALQTVNGKHGGANSDFDAWNREHQSAFWGVTRVENGVGLTGDKRASVFARPATDEFLARQFGLQGDDVLTSGAIKDAVERRLGEYKSDLLDLAQQQGYRVTSVRGGARTLAPADQRTFIQGVVRGTLPTGQSNNRVRTQLTQSLEETLTNSPKTRARAVYNETFGTFNDFYTSRASAIENASSSSFFSREMRRAGVEQTMIDGRQSRAQYVLGLVRPGSQVQGPSHAELALREYHAREVARTPRSMYTISDRLAVSAASEIEGRTVGRSEAFQILEREGFTGAVPRTQPARQRQRPSTEGEAAYQLMRQNPGMTLEAAKREVKRNRGDAELVRTATYLAARADFKENPRLGKPCGASHIPKAHECRKGRGADAPDAPERAKPAHMGRKIALATVVAAVGAIGVTVALDAHRFYKAEGLPNPPGYREAVRAAQAGDPKVSYDVAIGLHYDKVTAKEGWKPGDLVYTRFGSGSAKQDPTAHFAVYMGKQGARHQFADFGVADSALREGHINLYEYGPGAKGVAPFVFAKAPALKGTSPFSSSEIEQRVFASLGARLKYDALDNNCETWARMITTGQARSAQAERLSVLTRSLYRYYDRKTAGAPPKDIPSVKQQARILDMQARMAAGDKSARADLRAFQALIKQGKRTDEMQQDTEDELPTPAQLLAGSTSDADAVVRTKLYLMLLIRLGEARVYGPA